MRRCHYFANNTNLLSSEALFSAPNAPNVVCLPGSAQTRWRAKALPDPLAVAGKEVGIKIGRTRRRGREEGEERKVEKERREAVHPQTFSKVGYMYDTRER